MRDWVGIELKIKLLRQSVELAGTCYRKMIVTGMRKAHSMRWTMWEVEEWWEDMESGGEEGYESVSWIR